MTRTPFNFIGERSEATPGLWNAPLSALSADLDTLLSGSKAGGTPDGLSIWDDSGGTLIVTFSKQSVRFTAPVVGRITDTGGQVLNVRSFGALANGINDDSGAIQATIDATNATNIGGTV